VADHVEHGHARPHAEGHIAQCRMQRMPEPATLEQVHELSPSRDRIERFDQDLAQALESSELLDGGDHRLVGELAALVSHWLAHSLPSRTGVDKELKEQRWSAGSALDDPRIRERS